MSMHIKAKLAVAGVVLAALSGAAHAEADYSNMRMTFILYIMIALAIMAGQAIYLMCLPGASVTRKLAWVLGLAGADAFAVFILYLLTFETRSIDPEGVFGYILVVIPGFVYVASIKSYLSGKAGNA
jgi:hypothetical protein